MKTRITQGRAKQKNQDQEFLSTEKIEDSFPSGTIYTIYSLNIRYLFQLNSEKKSNEDIEDLKNEIKKIVKKKAEIRQDIFRLEKSLENDVESYINKYNFKNEFPKFAEETNVELLTDEIKKYLYSQIEKEERNHIERELKIEEEKTELKNKLRLAENFLVSDEFARFARDPYFKICKTKKRFLKINGERCLLYNATKEEKDLINKGHEFSVFRGGLRDKWLNSTTYKITTQKTKISYYIRLSELGLLQIRKEEPLRKEKKLINILADLLKYKEQNKQYGEQDEEEEKLRSADVLQVAIEFAKLLEFRITSNFVEIFGQEEIEALPYEKAKIKYLKFEKQRYLLILFNRLESFSGDRNLTPSFIHRNHSEVIACILQGTLESLKNDSNDVEKYRIHKIPQREQAKIDDVSTWTNEVCAFSPERGFIFFNDMKTLEEGGLEIDYIDYWKCIVRGVEYVVALRVCLQLLESKTTHLLNKTPQILKAFNESKFQELDLEKETNAETQLKSFSEDVANILKILPPVRSICIPTNAFRSGHSVKKFLYLQETCFNFSETLANIQKNIDELTNFLTFFKQLQLQIRFDAETSREAREDKKLNKIALLFTSASIIYVSPSFIHDLTDFIKNDEKPFGMVQSISIILYVVVLVFVAVLIISIVKEFRGVSFSIKKLKGFYGFFKKIIIFIIQIITILTRKSWQYIKGKYLKAKNLFQFSQID